MNKQLLQRNKCIVWYNSQQDRAIFTCLKEKKGFISLRGMQAWLWGQLSKSYSINELRNLLRRKKTHPQYSHKIERAARPLIKKGILSYSAIMQDKAKPALPRKYQKYNELYLSLSVELNSAENFTNNKRLNLYHKESIRTTHGHFENNEPTVSHVYREAHPALGGLSYGARLFRKLDSIKKITPQSVIVEVGGGMGFLTRSFLGEYRKDYDAKSLPKYTCCDLAFKFLESQREVNRQHSLKYCQVNAEQMPFKDSSLDFIIANENIADFTAVKLNKKTVLDFLANKIDLSAIKDVSIKRSLQWIKFSSLDVSDAAPEFIFNLGAIEFVNQIKRVLKNGGVAFITEYGDMNNYPRAVSLVGHVEYSIHFNHLIKTIKELGMEVEVCTLLDFLGFKKDIAVIDACSLGFLCAMLKKDKINLPFLAYTKGMLKKRIPRRIGRFNNLKFFKLAQRSVCHNLDRFYTLLIFKEGGDAPCQRN